jgi:hypothetical protein
MASDRRFRIRTLGMHRTFERGMVGEKLAAGTGDLMHDLSASPHRSQKSHQLPEDNPQKTPGEEGKTAPDNLPKHFNQDASDNNLTS